MNYIRRSGGFSMIEAIISIAIVGIIALAISNAKQYITKTQFRAQAEVEMQTDALRITETISVAMRKAGGVPNLSTGLFQIFRDLQSITGSTEIVFFSKDVNNNGQMDDADEWTYLGLDNGQVVERIHNRMVSDSSDAVTVLSEKIMNEISD